MSKNIMQLCADEIARYLKRIAELEEELEDWQDGTIIAQWQDYEQKVKELEKQLAESERQYQEYRQIVEKDIEKEVDERMRDTIKEFNLDISQLKQQLAESEEENETFRKALQGEIFINYKIPMEIERLKQELAEKDKLINEYADLAVKEIKAEDFAIDILEELDGSSNYINSKLDFECGFYISQKTIRDKIKELKG